MLKTFSTLLGTQLHHDIAFLDNQATAAWPIPAAWAQFHKSLVSAVSHHKRRALVRGNSRSPEPPEYASPVQSRQRRYRGEQSSPSAQAEKTPHQAARDRKIVRLRSSLPRRPPPSYL